MAFRMLSNGVVEVDTLDELRQLQRSRSRERRLPTHGASVPVPKHSGDLSDTTKQFLLVLMKASKGMNTEQAARLLHLDSRGIPPLLRGIARWCRDRNVDRNSLLISKAVYVNRRPVTHYTLTDAGKTTFGPIAADQAANLNGKEGSASSAT
jgi:hypothetical protein